MKRKKWNATLPAELLVLKLAEEVGEVAREITDAHMQNQGYVNNKRVNAELDHVQHLVTVLREKFPLYRA